MVKAQVHAGGRGKGGGVKLAKKLTTSRRDFRANHRNAIDYSSNFC
jgi:succinyl-CoA synthetase beta subunit